MSLKDYYGSEERNSVSYLEFGGIDLKEKTKKIWAYWQDQEAYDLYMLSRYARDLFSFRDFVSEGCGGLLKLNEVIINSAHDKILDYIFKYAGLITAADKTAVCESGSSIYGWIDEAAALDTVFHNGENKSRIQNLTYVASDISDIMNKGAQAFHPDINMPVSTAPTIADLALDIKDRLQMQLSLFYGLSVSLRYALRKPEDIIKICDISNLFLSNRLSLSLGDTYTMVYGTGKTVYIISLPELKKLLREYGYVAKYCTAGMQHRKDGEHSIRVSLAISKDERVIDRFITEYNYCTDFTAKYMTVQQGEWKDLEELEAE